MLCGPQLNRSMTSPQLGHSTLVRQWSASHCQNRRARLLSLDTAVTSRDNRYWLPRIEKSSEGQMNKPPFLDAADCFSAVTAVPRGV